MGTRLTRILVCALATALLCALPVSAHAEGRLPGSSDPVAERHGIADCLVIQDAVGYGNADVVALQAAGIDYDVVNTANLASWDLVEYKFIMCADAQREPFYTRLAANLPKLQEYVEYGGLLYVHAYSSFAADHDVFPGPVAKVSSGYSMSATVIGEPTHRLLESMPPGYFDPASDDSNGSFAGLPPEANVLVVASDLGNAPVYVEYRVGNGTVVADAMGPEYFYSEAGLPKMLENQLAFGAAWWRTVESDCFTEQDIAMPVKVGFTVGHKLKVSVSDTNISLGAKVLPEDVARGTFVLGIWSNDDVECRMFNGDFAGEDFGVNDDPADTVTCPDGSTPTDWGGDDRYDIDESAPLSIAADRLSIEIDGNPFAKNVWQTVADGPTGNAGALLQVALVLDPTYADSPGYYTSNLTLDVRQF